VLELHQLLGVEKQVQLQLHPKPKLRQPRQQVKERELQVQALHPELHQQAHLRELQLQ
jgi:hypothetical protein